MTLKKLPRFWPAELRAQGEFQSQWRRKTQSSQLCRKPDQWLVISDHNDGDKYDYDYDYDYDKYDYIILIIIVILLSMAA